LGTARYQASMFDYHSAPRFESDQGKCCGAGDENRTRMTSLEGWGSAIELHPHSVIIEAPVAFRRNHGVGATGLEPAIFCSQSRRASRYATPRPSGNDRTFATSVGHSNVEANRLVGTRQTEVWRG
jgi:hypothetical protein